jgi:tetratricopeptide (TPR) repeat protein
LELDDALAEAHTSLAAIRDWYEFDKEGAEEAYRRAIELKYNYPTAHHWYALHLMMKKRYDEAIREILVAAELDPLSTIIGTDVGVVYSHAERYEEAVEQFRKVLASDPDFVDAHVGLGRAYQFMGKYQDAIAAHKRAIELSGSVTLLADLGWLYAASGAKEEARKILEQMRKASAKRYVPRESLILIYSALDMKDEAFEALERLFRDGSGHLANMMLDARLDNLRSDPRYMNLVRRIGVKS